MCRSQEEVGRIDRLSEEIGTIQSLKNSFNPILNVILMALDAPAIFMRTKALRALGQIVTSDATILSAVSGVRNCCQSRFYKWILCSQMSAKGLKTISWTVRRQSATQLWS